MIPPHERFSQTLHTIHSIKHHDPTAQIVLLDNSSMQPHHDWMNQLQSQVSHCEWLGWQAMHQYFNHNGVKGVGEALMIQVGLDLIGAHNWHRVFKISGRYALMCQFDIQDHLRHPHHWCFKTRHRSASGRWALHTRMWSMCHSQIPRTQKWMYESAHAQLQLNLTLEEAMWHTWDLTMLTEMDIIHCEGMIAPWNKLIQD